MTDGRRLTRSETDKMIAGVAGGLAQYFNIDPTLVRVAFVLLAVFGGSGLIVYLVMWLIVPAESRVAGHPRDTMREGASEMRESAERLADDVRETFGGKRAGEATEEPGEPSAPGGTTDPGGEEEEGSEGEVT
ncbi:MAG: PspC domain-containing protein [Nitriliruptorales bacterium]